MSRIKLIMCVVMTFVLCIMTLGYAALQERIDVEVRADIDSTYRVEITRVQEETVVGDARSVSAPSYHDLTSTFNVGLTNDTDYITYTIEVTNYSTVDIRLNNTEISTTNNNISFVKSEIRNGNIMLAGSTKTVTIKIKLDTETGSEEKGTVTLALDFTRLKGGVGEIQEDHYYSAVPINYQECECIESNGTQYIDTGIYVKSNTRVEMNIALLSTSGDQKFFGSYGNGGFCLGVYKEQWRIGGSTWYYGTVPLATTDKTFVTIEHGTFTFNDSAYSAGYSIIENNQHSIVVFAIAYNGSLLQKGSIKLYDLKLYEDSNLVQNLIPALDNNGVPCMYDTVSGETFYNQGTGDFLYQLKE